MEGKKKSSYQHNRGSAKRKMLEKVKNNPKQCELNFNLTIEKPQNAFSPTTNLIISESSSTSLPCSKTEPSSKLLPNTTMLNFNSKSNSTFISSPAKIEPTIFTAPTTEDLISNSSPLNSPMQKPSTNSVLQDISPEKIIKSIVSSTKLITRIHLNLLNSHTKDSILDTDQRELDNDSSSS